MRVEMYEAVSGEAVSEDPGRPRLARPRFGLRAGSWSLLTVTVLAVGLGRLEEDCPSSDARSSDLAPGPASDVPAVMPNLLGRSARAAEETLGSNASVLLRDATGQDRAVLVTSNWQVCEQSPRAGGSLAGAPVTLKVVKYGEDC
ncbi:PASTA domain-containing protein [Actinopolymorpha pittospori]|uniref:PASTA domain-containing protein n=1 Tax=Actinopolymorpha pittospori TaxID=648752 RepID=A0A927MPN9_9ACTN|nr:PASTA domain-containing protein [Actinopolymorpha pittospori]MBE1604566.1 hypothetical protein [Actinopolymorpha pittospori]